MSSRHEAETLEARVRLLESENRRLAAVEKELHRQKYNLELIASENIVSRAVMAVQGSVLTNKYAEGYPDKRYYGGCEYVDQAEDLAIERARALFQAEYVNVQPHSGTSANLAVYFGVLDVGDRILAMSLPHGGHLSHGHRASATSKCFNFKHYALNPDTERLDYDEIRKLALEFKPKMIVTGASSYPRLIDYEKVQKLPEKWTRTC